MNLGLAHACVMENTTSWQQRDLETLGLLVVHSRSIGLAQHHACPHTLDFFFLSKNFGKTCNWSHEKIIVTDYKHGTSGNVNWYAGCLLESHRIIHIPTPRWPLLYNKETRMIVFNTQIYVLLIFPTDYFSVTFIIFLGSRTLDCIPRFHVSHDRSAHFKWEYDPNLITPIKPPKKPPPAFIFILSLESSLS